MTMDTGTGTDINISSTTGTNNDAKTPALVVTNQKNGSGQSVTNQKNGPNQSVANQKNGSTQSVVNQKNGSTQSVANQKNGSTQSVGNQKNGSNQSINGFKSEPNQKKNSGQLDLDIGIVLPFKQGDSLVPRRLSRLFTPPGENLLPNDTDKVTESTCLLGEVSEKKPSIVLKLSKEEVVEEEEDELKDKGKLSFLDQIKHGSSTSKLCSSSQTSTNHSTSTSSSNPSEDPNDKVADYTSWDDTICSNRSTYFKHYYQKYSSALVSSRASTQASSRASLASLIKEKNKLSSNANKDDDKKKRRENLGLMALVVFLFLVLIIGISLIYHFYNVHLEELSLFKKLKFHEDLRLLNLYDSNGKMDIQAILGTTLSPYSKPEDCTHYLHYLRNLQIERDYNEEMLLSLANETDDSDVLFRNGYKHMDEFQFDEETVCLDWANQARIQIHKAPTSKEFVNCYNVFWSAQNPGLALQDCVQIKSPEFGTWWGIGDITGGGYPLQSLKIPPSPLSTGQLGKDPWGRILRRIFVSSHGGLMMLPDHLPASVSITSEELCVGVNITNPVDKMVPLTLNYTVCASPNISSTMRYLHHLAGVVSVKVSSDNETTTKKKNSLLRARILEQIEDPVWVPNLLDLTQESVLSYVDQILAYNESLWGHILLPTKWQHKPGMFEFDPELFPDSRKLSQTLRLKGFHLALTISPSVSTNTEAFKNGTKEQLFVQQRGSNLPALISHDSVTAGALVDFTNPRAVEWFQSKLKAIKVNYNIDRFHLHPVDSLSIPYFHEFNGNIPNPDLALEPFLEAVAKVSQPLSTDCSLGPPSLPIFVTVGNQESAWASLSSMVARILTLTMLGFPLVDAGIVGGNSGRPGNIPEDELFIRWSQAAAFLPAFQMSTVPNRYDIETESIVTNYFQKRKEFVLPRLSVAVDNTLLNHSALISPLALLYPDDPEAAEIDDEWIIGVDLLVAPVLERGKTSRDIYIPDGLWESQLDGRLKRGPGWISGYKVPLTDLAYFIKRYYSALSL